MLYQTTVVNEDGIRGNVLFSDNIPLLTKHPLEGGEGYNPEQLLASAWSTCLNATIQSILESRGQQSRSTVDITVSLCKEVEVEGYYFQVDASVAIEGWTINQAQLLVQEAHQRCPVSKLLVGAESLTLSVVEYPTKNDSSH